MKKISIIGCGGSGKSTLARSLGEITDIRVHHLDRLFWKPGWESITTEELAGKIKDIISEDSWIIDGNYMSTMEMRIEAADTVIYMDLPTISCLWGITKRRFMYAGKGRPDITAGCDEKLDLEFVNWVFTFRRKNRKKLLEYMEKYSAGRNMIILKSRGQVKNFLADLKKENR